MIRSIHNVGHTRQSCLVTERLCTPPRPADRPFGSRPSRTRRQLATREDSPPRPAPHQRERHPTHSGQRARRYTDSWRVAPPTTLTRRTISRNAPRPTSTRPKKGCASCMEQQGRSLVVLSILAAAMTAAAEPAPATFTCVTGTTCTLRRRYYHHFDNHRRDTPLGFMLLGGRHHS